MIIFSIPGNCPERWGVTGRGWNKDFGAVLEQIPNVFAQHSCYVRKVEYTKDTGFRFILRSPQDPQRFLTITLLAFNIPLSNSHATPTESK